MPVPIIHVIHDSFYFPPQGNMLTCLTQGSGISGPSQMSLLSSSRSSSLVSHSCGGLDVKWHQMKQIVLTLPITDCSPHSLQTIYSCFNVSYRYTETHCSTLAQTPLQWQIRISNGKKENIRLKRILRVQDGKMKIPLMPIIGTFRNQHSQKSGVMWLEEQFCCL